MSQLFPHAVAPRRTALASDDVHFVDNVFTVAVDDIFAVECVIPIKRF